MASRTVAKYRHRREMASQRVRQPFSQSPSLSVASSRSSVSSISALPATTSTKSSSRTSKLRGSSARSRASNSSTSAYHQAAPVRSMSGLSVSSADPADDDLDFYKRAVQDGALSSASLTERELRQQRAKDRARRRAILSGDRSVSSGSPVVSARSSRSSRSIHSARTDREFGAARISTKDSHSRISPINPPPLQKRLSRQEQRSHVTSSRTEYREEEDSLTKSLRRSKSMSRRRKEGAIAGKSPERQLRSPGSVRYMSDKYNGSDSDSPQASPKVEMKRPGRRPRSGFVKSESVMLLPPLSDKRGYYRGMVGLKNLGNTCFMNSCLQSICSTPVLLRYFDSGNYLKHINTNSRIRGNLARTFAALIKSLQTGKAGSVERPSEIKRTVAYIAPRFSGYGQQDVQEFLQFLLDGLHDDLNRVRVKPKYEEIKDIDGESDAQRSSRWWANYTARNDSFISQVFSGQLRSVVQCLKCKHVSTAFDPFWDISVPIPRSARRSSFLSSGSCSLEDCLDAYTSSEILKGNEQYYCSKCKKHRDSKKQLTLWRLPPVLVISIKRFGDIQSRFSLSRSKLDTKIKFPVRGLDVSAYAPPHTKQEDTVYDLYAVANHSGGLGGGHYTAYAKVSDSQWCCFNDSRVSTVPEARLQGSEAYVLFYQQRCILDA